MKTHMDKPNKSLYIHTLLMSFLLLLCLALTITTLMVDVVKGVDKPNQVALKNLSQKTPILSQNDISYKFFFQRYHRWANDFHLALQEMARKRHLRLNIYGNRPGLVFARQLMNEGQLKNYLRENLSQNVPSTWLGKWMAGSWNSQSRDEVPPLAISWIPSKPGKLHRNN